MKRVASPGLMHDTGCLGLVHWDDPEGWYVEGGGNQPGKAQGFQGTRQAQNDFSGNSAFAASFPSVGLPCVETTVCFPLTFPITGLNRDL